MADIEGVKDTKNYFAEVPASHEGFHLKGAHQLDWGMRNRLSKVFRPSTGVRSSLKSPLWRIVPAGV